MVGRLVNAVYWINLYPVDNAIRFVITYPLDSDLSVGYCYPPFLQLVPDWLVNNIKVFTTIQRQIFIPMMEANRYVTSNSAKYMLG